MSKYYCFPDIHGNYKLLKKALDYVYEKNPDGGKIIFLGDYIDRGPENVKVLQTVMNPPDNWEFICLKGNHEAMFVDSYKNRDRFYDITATKEIGGFDIKVLVPYENLHDGIDPEYVKWMDALKIFHIEDNNVFAHAYYDDTLSPDCQNEMVCLWDRMSDTERYWNSNQNLYLTHGHTPRKHAPVFAQERVNLDAGGIFYGRYIIGEYEKDKKGPINIYEFSD